MSKILVTGGAGFIGSHLVNSLINKGHEVVVIDNLSLGKFENIGRIKKISPKISFFEADIRNYESIKNFFRNVEVVFHLAAQSNVDVSIKEPIKDMDINLKGTLNVLRAAANSGTVKKLIFFSSAAVYGNTKKFPIKEDLKLKPISPYGFSKLFGEEFCRVFSELYGIETYIFRTFNVYGKGSGGVIQEFVNNLKQNQPLTVYGDGKQTRDFLHVNDVVSACLLTLKSDLKKKFAVYNLANGEETNLNNIINILKKSSRKKFEVIHEKPRPGDIKRSFASNSKIEKELKYKPKYTLEKGIKELLKG